MRNFVTNRSAGVVRLRCRHVKRIPDIFAEEDIDVVFTAWIRRTIAIANFLPRSRTDMDAKPR